MADKKVTLYPVDGFVLGFGLAPKVLPDLSPEEADRLLAEYPSGYTKEPPKKDEKPAEPDKEA